MRGLDRILSAALVVAIAVSPLAVWAATQGDGDSVVLRHRRHEWPKCRRDDREAAGMGLFKRRKSRATRRAEARAIKAKAKLEAKLAAKKNEVNQIARLLNPTPGHPLPGSTGWPASTSA